MGCLVEHMQSLSKDTTCLPLNQFIKQFVFPTVSTFSTTSNYYTGLSIISELYFFQQRNY